MPDKKKATYLSNPTYSLILNHWREFQPSLVRQLEQSHDLFEAVNKAGDLHLELQWSLLKQGRTVLESWEIASLAWMYPDEKSDNPHPINMK